MQLGIETKSKRIPDVIFGLFLDGSDLHIHGGIWDIVNVIRDSDDVVLNNMEYVSVKGVLKLKTHEWRGGEIPGTRHAFGEMVDGRRFFRLPYQK